MKILIRNSFLLTLLPFILLLHSCNDENYKSFEDIEKKAVQEKKKKDQYQAHLQSIGSYQEWYNHSLKKAPRTQKYSYINKLEHKDIEVIYSFLKKEFINKSSTSDGRYNTLEKGLAEKFNVHYKVFTEVNNFMGLEYLPYLEKITKEFFLIHKNSIVPDHYNSIGTTAFLGDYTFNCTLNLKICKDSKELEKEINEHLNYLKISLPTIMSGFRIFDVKYDCKETGTTGSLDIGFIWKRDGDILLKKKSSTGTYGGKREPENNRYWHEDSWNDNKALSNSSELLIKVLQNL